MWPTLPGTIAGCAASGLFGSCAVPAGGVAAAGAVVAAAWLGAGACATAAAGVSPAAAKAITHPISFIDTPDSVPGTGSAEARPDLAGSIGAAFWSLKHDLGWGVAGVHAAA